jgi:2-oxoglutarate ferredoxin oxidoreductase subunit gamma
MKDIEIRLSGSGGQGILLASHILADALTLEDRIIAQSQSYEPTSRGGLSRSDLIAGAAIADYPLASALDYLVILDRIALNASDDLLQQDTLVIIDSTLVDAVPQTQGKHVLLPLQDTARKLDDIRSANMVALGALLTLGEICRLDSLYHAVRREAPAKLIDSMTDAIRAGQQLALEAA